MNFFVKNQVNVIREPGSRGTITAAQMPLVLVFPDGLIAQTISIRGAISLIAGYDYFNMKDANAEWNFRLAAAQKQALAALETGVLTAIYDPIQGIVQNSGSLAPDPIDSTYELRSNENKPKNIYIQNDRLFILSLIQIGAVTVYEREDSFQLRDHRMWRQLKSKEIIQNCSWCLHGIKEAEGARSEYYCPIYNLNTSKNEGENCCSFAFNDDNKDPSDLVYPYGAYHNISLTYDIDKLFDTVGQSWIVPDITF